MNKEDFESLADQGFNHVPLVVESFADLDTPLSIYLKFANKPFSYLLESVQGAASLVLFCGAGKPSHQLASKSPPAQPPFWHLGVVTTHDTSDLLGIRKDWIPRDCASWK